MELLHTMRGFNTVFFVLSFGGLWSSSEEYTYILSRTHSSERSSWLSSSLSERCRDLIGFCECDSFVIILVGGLCECMFGGLYCFCFCVWLCDVVVVTMERHFKKFVSCAYGFCSCNSVWILTVDFSSKSYDKKIVLKNEKEKKNRNKFLN